MRGLGVLMSLWSIQFGRGGGGGGGFSLLCFIECAHASCPSFLDTVSSKFLLVCSDRSARQR